MRASPIWIVPLLASSWRPATAAENKALPHRSEYRVEGLEEIQPAFGEFEGTMYAGLIPFDNGDRHGEYMFWLFHPSGLQQEETVTMWLNGGPGCTSFSAGLAYENSPVTTTHRPAGECCGHPDDPFGPNPYAWTNATVMLYVEQPAGTGFSTGPEPLAELDLSGDMHSFLQNFFDIFDDLRPKPFFIFGESYAGMYVPSIAHYIFKANSKKRGSSSADRRINLAGIALGNGWIEARTQGPAVIDYAWWHGMIDSNTRSLLHEQWELCVEDSDELDPTFHEFTIPDECGIMGEVLRAAGAGLLNDRDPNTYDVTTFDTYPVIDIDPNHPTTINTFFNDARVKEALHAPRDILWRGCVEGSGRRRLLGRRGLLMLDHDRPESTAPYLATLMDEGNVRVLVYNGDRDLSTNSAGTEQVLDRMTEWSQNRAWKTGAAPRGLWTVPKDTEVAGWSKELQRLTFLVVYNSGHMVPYNRPPQALDLVARFVRNATFIDREIAPFVPRRGNAGGSNEEGNHHKSVPRGQIIFWCAFGAVLLSGLIYKYYRDFVLHKRQHYQAVDQRGIEEKEIHAS